jgi:hypothetical protein
MSLIDAPPDAKQGDPKNPCKNRNMMSPAKVFSNAVGMDMMTKMPIVMM